MVRVSLGLGSELGLGLGCKCLGLWLWLELTLPKTSAGSILDISKYRDTCERSISILGGIAILRYIEYRMNQ